MQNNQFNKTRRITTTTKQNKRNHNNKISISKTAEAEKELPEKITFSGSLTVGALAEELGKEPSELIKN